MTSYLCRCSLISVHCASCTIHVLQDAASLVYYEVTTAWLHGHHLYSHQSERGCVCDNTAWLTSIITWSFCRFYDVNEWCLTHDITFMTSRYDVMCTVQHVPAPVSLEHNDVNNLWHHKIEVCSGANSCLCNCKYNPLPYDVTNTRRQTHDIMILAYRARCTVQASLLEHNDITALLRVRRRSVYDFTSLFTSIMTVLPPGFKM